MIYATPEDEYGNRRVFLVKTGYSIGAFFLENGRAVFYPASSVPFTYELLDAVLNFQKSIDP